MLQHIVCTRVVKNGYFVRVSLITLVKKSFLAVLGGDIEQISVPSLSPKGISPKVIGGPTVAGRPDRLNSKYPL